MEHIPAADGAVTADPTDADRARRRQALVDVVIAGRPIGRREPDPSTWLSGVLATASPRPA